MSAFWIAHVTVTNEEAYAKYAALATQAIAAHGGTFLARGGTAIQKEGRAHPRNVVATFPSLDAAKAKREFCNNLRSQTSLRIKLRRAGEHDATDSCAAFA